MTKNRKGLSPLSQTGLLRIPQNPKQRIPGSKKREIGADSKLDKANEVLAEREDRVLHPTRGFRKLSVKSSIAAMTVAEIKAGMVPWSMRPAMQGAARHAALRKQ